MRKILNHLFEQKTLTRQEAEEVLTNIATNKYSDSEIAAFITVYLMRSITVEELSGFRDALLNQCIKVDLSEFKTIDVCGTGGDSKDTFNISLCRWWAGWTICMLPHHPPCRWNWHSDFESYRKTRWRPSYSVWALFYNYCRKFYPVWVGFCDLYNFGG